MNGHAHEYYSAVRLSPVFCRSLQMVHTLTCNVSVKRVLDRLLLLIGTGLEFLFGMYVAAIAGSLLGLWAGRVYIEHLQPVYFSSYSSLSEISEWLFRPYVFALQGRIVGAVLGAIVIAVIHSRWRHGKRAVVRNQGLGA